MAFLEKMQYLAGAALFPASGFKKPLTFETASRVAKAASDILEGVEELHQFDLFLRKNRGKKLLSPTAITPAEEADFLASLRQGGSSVAALDRLRVALAGYHILEKLAFPNRKREPRHRPFRTGSSKTLASTPGVPRGLNRNGNHTVVATKVEPCRPHSG